MRQLFHRDLPKSFTIAYVMILFIMLTLCLVPSLAKADEVGTSPVEVNVYSSPYEAPQPPLARSWYGESLYLSKQSKSGSYYFDGNNIGIEMTASCSTGGSFTASLYRMNGANLSFIGSATFKRNGFTKATWSNVGSGTYRFVFTKTSDGSTVTSSDVAMYSW